MHVHVRHCLGCPWNPLAWQPLVRHDGAVFESVQDLREHELPRVLRHGHAKVVDARGPRERREGAFYLWQDTLLHLASLAFAEYRRYRLDSPAPRVENVLAKWPRPWAENYAELLRSCLAEGPEPGIFAPSLADNVRLKQSERLRRAVEAVDTAVEADYHTCSTLVKRELERPGKQHILLGPMLNLYVDYRNKAIGHQDTSKWRQIEDLDDVLSPLLQDVAFELLGHPQVRQVILDHPVGQLVKERSVAGGVEHVVKLEFRGTERRAVTLRETAITAEFKDPRWCARPGGKILLQASELDGKLEIHIIGPFHDFVANDDQPIVLELASPTPAVDERQHADLTQVTNGHASSGPESQPQAARRITEDSAKTDALHEVPSPMVGSAPSGIWFALAKWGKDTGQLSPWERSFSFNIGRNLHSGRELTSKQLKHSERILSKAQDAGFDPAGDDEPPLPPHEINDSVLPPKSDS